MAPLTVKAASAVGGLTTSGRPLSGGRGGGGRGGGGGGMKAHSMHSPCNEGGALSLPNPNPNPNPNSHSLSLSQKYLLCPSPKQTSDRGDYSGALSVFRLSKTGLHYTAQQRRGSATPGSLAAGAPFSETVTDDSTYGVADVWSEGELERLKSMQRGCPPGSLLLTRGVWDWQVRGTHHYLLRGQMRFHNMSDHHEIFVAEVDGKSTLLAGESLGDDVICSVKIISKHPNNNPPSRSDGYWRAYITRAREFTDIQVLVDITSQMRPLSILKAAKITIAYVSYGPHGRLPLQQHVILPLSFPLPLSSPSLPSSPPWQIVGPGLSVLPVPTHLLTHMDNPLQVLRRYALPLMQPGDTVAIGESPLAIMQGRFRHPCNMRPGAIARLCCRPFHPTSSLATACGMQALVDLVGRVRVILAVILAAVARFLGKRGVFYEIAGEQSRLIDDVTGTLPPYDQFITLGPLRPQETAEALSSKIGMGVAIVDVNDLWRVDILGISPGVDKSSLYKALTSNPAGNADQQTPLVLIRGCSSY